MTRPGAAPRRKRFDRRTPKEPGKTLRWFVGIPIGTNPLILIDVLSLLLVAWGLMAIILMVLQLWFGGYLDATHLRGSFFVSGYVTLVFAGVFVFAAWIVQKNRYAALYRFEDEEVFCENLRTSPRPVKRSLFPRWRGYAIEDVTNPLRSVVKSAAWKDVRSVSTLDRMGVLLLRGKKRVLMRVYCPDSHTFDRALTFAEAMLESRRESSFQKETDLRKREEN